ncbi:Mitogen-activated protein kinase 11 [Sarracenia purpurea var. burkii]
MRLLRPSVPLIILLDLDSPDLHGEASYSSHGRLDESLALEFSAKFSNMSLGAVDLLEKMLDPYKRITGTM